MDKNNAHVYSLVHQYAQTFIYMQIHQFLCVYVALDPLNIPIEPYLLKIGWCLHKKKIRCSRISGWIYFLFIGSFYSFSIHTDTHKGRGREARIRARERTIIFDHAFFGCLYSQSFHEIIYVWILMASQRATLSFEQYKSVLLKTDR